MPESSCTTALRSVIPRSEAALTRYAQLLGSDFVQETAVITYKPGLNWNNSLKKPTEKRIKTLNNRNFDWAVKRKIWVRYHLQSYH